MRIKRWGVVACAVALLQSAAVCRADEVQDFFNAIRFGDWGSAKKKPGEMLTANPALAKAHITANSEAALLYWAVPKVENWTPLHQAAAHSRPEAAIALIGKGADVNARDGLGRTPLFLTTQSLNIDSSDHGNAFIAELLIRSGASPEIGDKKGRLPLHQAARRGLKELVGLLHKGGNISLEAVDSAGSTVLEAAIGGEHRDKDIVNFILKAGAKPTFFSAVHENDLKKVAAMLNADPRLANRARKNGAAPLNIAVHAHRASAPHYAMIELLLKNGANPDAGNAALLDFAVRRNDKTLAGLLLAHGASPNLSVYVLGYVPKTVPLISVARDDAMKKLLLKYGAKSVVKHAL